MKKNLALMIALVAFCGAVNAATMVTSPASQSSQNLLLSQLSSLTQDTPVSWDTSKINFGSVFGNAFNPGTQELRVTLLGANFGINADGSINPTSNGYGVGGDMYSVAAGSTGFSGMDSYISFDAGESVSLLLHSDVLGQDFNVFGENNGSFAWDTTDLLTEYYKDGQLVSESMKTLLVGFDDSPGMWDNDFNDLILAIQVVPKGANAGAGAAGPSGQPLPGVMAALLLGGGALAIANRRRKSRAA
ncbi:MAG: DUF4114 domain-containing protein [Victivallales bacterium]|jgi:hypothetical protein|nr:DUF4114 domain-containing protein [Victivallales bacterium]